MKAKFLVSLLFAALSLFGEDFDPFGGPKPLAIVIQTQPWASVIGADNPRFAMYDDGTLIFLASATNANAYLRATLSKKELAEFKEKLKPVFAVKDLKDRYTMGRPATDQPSTLFYLRQEDRELTASVYGLTRRTATNRSGTTVQLGGQEVVPSELLELYKYCSSMHRPGEEWIPRYVEVMVWPYDYAPEESIVWPNEWPNFKGPRAMQRGNSYSIFLDGNAKPELRRFLATRKEKGAVEIEGKKWAASWRDVFPSEPIWREAMEGGTDASPLQK